jgi:hypothetical protein
MFKALGLDQKDLKAGTHDFTGLVTNLADGFGKLNGGTERQAPRSSSWAAATSRCCRCSPRGRRACRSS